MKFNPNSKLNFKPVDTKNETLSSQTTAGLNLNEKVKGHTPIIQNGPLIETEGTVLMTNWGCKIAGAMTFGITAFVTEAVAVGATGPGAVAFTMPSITAGTMAGIAVEKACVEGSGGEYHNPRQFSDYDEVMENAIQIKAESESQNQQNEENNEESNDDDADDGDDDGGFWEWLFGDDEDEDDGDGEDACWIDEDDDAGNPNPEDNGSADSPRIPRRPLGSMGAKLYGVFNPGAERGGQSGPDSDEDGDPGNPWDHSTKISRPDDDGNGVDPLTNPAGGSPRGGGRGPVNPDDDRQESGLWDDFYKPNPEDDWGVNGPNAKSLRSKSFDVRADELMDFVAISSRKSIKETGVKNLEIVGGRQSEEGHFQIAFEFDAKVDGAKSLTSMTQVVTGFLNKDATSLNSINVEVMPTEILA